MLVLTNLANNVRLKKICKKLLARTLNGDFMVVQKMKLVIIPATVIIHPTVTIPIAVEATMVVAETAAVVATEFCLEIK